SERRNGGVDRCRARRVHVQPVDRGAGEHTDPQPSRWVHRHRGGEGPRRGRGRPPRGRVMAGGAGPGGRRGCPPPGGRRARVPPTVRRSTPLGARLWRLTVRLVTRPRVGSSPTRPLHDAGIRIDPPPSSAWAMGAMPAATAAPAPLDDPPGVRSGSHGLREMPRASLSVKGTVPNSEVVVLPSSTNPASTNRCTTGSDASAGALLAPADPWVVGHPATSRRSLIGSGTP